MRTMDLNLDAGESPAALADGQEERLYALVTSVNIACGGHAGDAASMGRAVELALKYKLNIGAHPSYPDREGFGRTRPSHLQPAELTESLCAQLEMFNQVCRRLGARLAHVKPHGALYNDAAADPSTARAVLDAIKRCVPQARVMGLAQSPFLQWCKDAGFEPLAEAFCDRRYEDSYGLQSRKIEGAVIADASQAAAQAVEVASGFVTSVSNRRLPIAAQTLCVHGDSAGAEAIVKAVGRALRAAGVIVQAPR